MDKPRSLFESFLFEAEGDPPDLPADDNGPPEMPPDDPPDMGGDDAPTDAPADITDDPPEMGGDDTTDDFGEDEATDDAQDDAPAKKNENMALDDKVSAIMNANLYQRFLGLLTQITDQISSIKNNMDILHSVAPSSTETFSALTRLAENIRLYLTGSFEHENYSKNLLFFNKCLNLLKLLNDGFNKDIKKGIKEIK